MAEKIQKADNAAPQDEPEIKAKPKVTLIKKRPESSAETGGEPARPPVKRKVVIRRRPVEMPTPSAKSPHHHLQALRHRDGWSN